MKSSLLNYFLKLDVENGDREEKFITYSISWEAYESLLSSLGKSPSYRIA